MDEVVNLLQTTVLKLDEISDKLRDISDRVEEVSEAGEAYNIKDVCVRLDVMSSTLDSINAGIDLIGT